MYIHMCIEMYTYIDIHIYIYIYTKKRSPGNELSYLVVEFTLARPEPVPARSVSVLRRASERISRSA